MMRTRIQRGRIGVCSDAVRCLVGPFHGVTVQLGKACCSFATPAWVI